jgi:preprotein translocase subunit YajC
MPALPVLLLQAPAAAPTGGPSATAFFFQIGVIILIFYFIVLRPQRKQQKALEAALMSMSKGDEVTTSGGIVGEVLHIKESLKDGAPSASMADRVTIKSADSKLIVERGRIVRVTKAGS